MAPASVAPALRVARRTPARWSKYGGRCCSAGRPACSRDRAPARRRDRVPCASTADRSCTGRAAARPACRWLAGSPRRAAHVRTATGRRPDAGAWLSPTDCSTRTGSRRARRSMPRAATRAPATCCASPSNGSKPREQPVEPVPDEADHAVDAPVDEARDAGRPNSLGPGEQSRDAGDLLMHRLDQVDHAGNAGDGQPVDAAKIGSSGALDFLTMTWRLCGAAG